MTMRRNVAWSLAGAGLPLLLGAAAIPYLISRVGIEAVGILTLVWALIGYFSLFDFGLGRALTQQVASARAADGEEQLPGLIKSGLVFTLATGLAGGVLLALLAFPLGFHWLKVSAPLQHATALSLLIAAIGIPVTTMTTGLRGILEAFEDFRAVNVLRLLLGLANFGLPVLCVMFIGPSLVWMIASLIAARFVLLWAHLRLVNRKLAADWHGARFDLQHFKRLFAFGAWMTVSNIVGPLMVTADRFVISAFLGAAVVAYYTIPSEMLTRMLILPGALTAVLFPRLAVLRLENPAASRSLYRKSLKLITLAMAPLCLLIAVVSYGGLSFWLGEDFARKSWYLVAILALGIWFNSIAFVPFAAIQATGQAQITAKIHTLELLGYIPLLVLGLHYFGLAGAAIAWSLRTGVDLWALLVVARRFGFGACALEEIEKA